MDHSGGAARVDAAYDALAGVAVRTPLQRSDRHSAAFRARVWLKREDLQAVRSYKLRGAYFLIASLSTEDAARGVVCASAGNHAQGVAYACAKLGVKARIYVPGTTPRQKRNRILALGGDAVELVIRGDTYDAAFALASADAASSGRIPVPAFDHPDVIAGQGTVVREITEQLGRAPDVLVVPVGGAGLVAGCLSWLVEHAPRTRVIGVEPIGAESLTAALAAGHPVRLEEMDTFVDGAAVRQVGQLPLRIVQDYPGPFEVCGVDPGVLCEEMIELFQTEGVIAEPAGALATAALRQVSIPPNSEGTEVVCVVSGGNQDISRYGEVAERALISEGRKHYFIVEFPQEPGALRRFLDEVLGPDDDITLFEYVKRTSKEFGPALVGIELGNPDDLSRLMASLEHSPVHATRIPPSEAAFRYLV
jgi:threonine dehydratase